MTQNVRSNYEAVTGSKLKFFSFSLLLKGIQQTTGVRLLKMKKKVKNQPTLLGNTTRQLEIHEALVSGDEHTYLKKTLHFPP
jgi:hypothetical protein